MASEFDRITRSNRRYKARVKMLRQAKIAKEYGLDHGDSIHVYHKHRALNCGNPNCVMCANPRKVFGEITQQERKAELATEEQLELTLMDDFEL
jgi:hypothetical protein